MQLDEIIAKLKDIEAELLKRYPDYAKDPEKAILARSVKLNEEVGELMDEVLHKLKLQRAEKEYDPDNLQKEFGDVFNSLLLLGLSLGVDVPEAIASRVNEMYKKLSPRQ